MNGSHKYDSVIVVPVSAESGRVAEDFVQDTAGRVEDRTATRSPSRDSPPTAA